VSELAYQAAAVVASDARTQSINFNWIEPMRTLRIRVNQDEARLLGVSSQTLAQSLNAVVSGVNITQIRDDIYLIDVIARAGAEERISPATLKTLAIPLPNGKSVPLLQLASIEYGLDWPLIWRRDRLATITVSADLVGAVLPATVIGALEEKMTALQASFPAGYRVQVGGTAEESAKSLKSVAAGLPLAALIMLIVLMVQLQSVSRLFLVLSVAPFGLIGVVAAPAWWRRC
jgi:multidrug efflux pump subunit AcrB